MNSDRIHFKSPIDGDMLHAGDGIAADGYLQVPVSVAAPPNRRIRINGLEAAYADGMYTADVRLTGYENVLEALDETSGRQERITIFRLPYFAGNYRLSIDDNIWFLRDIHEHTATYQSIFDNPYLRFLRQINEAYGTKIHLNLFYQTDGFNLSQLTDKFRDEWRANADWLRLSFHALQEKPDRPYQFAGYEQVLHDCRLVKAQIRRFAGEEVMGPVTTLHWGESTVEGSRALRDEGYRGQLGYFNVDDDLPPVSYYLDVEKRRHLKKRFIWRDNREGIVFIRSSLVIDTKKREEIRPFLDAYATESRRPPYVDLLVHEQYYYPFYEAYQPDFGQRILTAVQWAADNGYRPAFLDECIFADNEPSQTNDHGN